MGSGDRSASNASCPPISVGVDLSSRKFAAVAVRGESILLHQFRGDSPKEEPPRWEWFYDIGMEFFQGVSEDGPFTVFIEAPLMGRAGVRVTIGQAQVQGSLGLAALHSGTDGVYEVNVQTWKKDVVGRGNASKSDVRDAIEGWLASRPSSRPGFPADNQDLCDALAIARYGTGVLTRSAEFVDGLADEGEVA